MTADALFILNRKSAARGDVRDAVEAVQKDHRIKVVIPWDGAAMREDIARALDEGRTRIIAGGGDGTLNMVANAVLATGTPAVSMGLVPLGTANDFARSFGDFGANLTTSLRRAAGGEARPIDVGRVNGRHFVNVASGGFGAMITATTPKDVKKRLGGLAYSLSGLARLSELKATPAKISIDGAAPDEVALLALILANSRYAGGGYDVAPEADLSDGQLDLAAITREGVKPGADRMSRLLDPSDTTGGLVDRSLLRSAVIETSDPFHLNLDGEPMVESRFEIDVLPGALRFALP